MKSLLQYIREAEGDKEKGESLNRRGNIRFTIWKEPDKKVYWLNDNDNYQRIEYKHEDKDKGLSMSFLLGFDEEQQTWKLWVGKIGGVTYDDDPLCDLETKSFAEAIISGLDKVEEYIEKVEEDPQDWIQYYKNL